VYLKCFKKVTLLTVEGRKEGRKEEAKKKEGTNEGTKFMISCRRAREEGMNEGREDEGKE